MAADLPLIFSQLQDLAGRRPSQRTLVAMKAASVAMIIALSLFAALTFPGFPRFTEDLYDAIGLEPEQLEQLGELAGTIDGDLLEDVSLSADCIELTAAINRVLVTDGVVDLTGLELEPYEDAGLAGDMAGRLGADTVTLTKTDIDGLPAIVGTAGGSCFATETEICFCG